MLHICFIGYVWPESISSAAGIRTEALVEQCQLQGWRVSFLSPSKPNAFSEKLTAKNIFTASMPANDDAFDPLIKDLAPDYVIFDRFVIEEQFSWRVAEQCPNAVRIIDTQDLHFLRRARMEALKKKSSQAEIFSGSIPLDSDDCLRELAAIHKSDLSLIISDFELDVLRAQFQIPDARLLLLPFSYKKNSAPMKSFADRQHFVFLGNFRHPPNYDSIFWLTNEIWPLISTELSSAELHIYGAYPPKEIADLHNPKRRIIFHGPAIDQYETLSQYKINLAPLRVGAGIKGKISDGWYVGTPTITTPIGQEGMGANVQPWGGLVASSAETIAQAAIDLYTDEKKWTVTQQSGREILDRYFDFQTNAKIFINTLLHYHRDRESLRAANIYGRILWQNQFKSTMYLSRWITLKNNKEV